MADQTKLRKRLEVLLKKPENQSCADCGKRGPRWASANLGTFFCIECSGIHRNLGVHISFVRSVNLDSWTLKQVEFMEEWGNARANAYYEAKLPRDYQKPRENDPVRVVEKFIREKYEQKRFIADSIPPPMSDSEPEPIKETRRATTNTTRVEAPSHTSNRTSATPVTNLPTRTVASAPPPKEEPNLLDFFDSPAPPAPAAPVQQQTHQQVDPFQSNGFGQQQQQQQNNFFNTQPAQSDPFFSTPPAVPTQQQQQNHHHHHEQQHYQQHHQQQQQFQDPFFGGGNSNTTQQQQQQNQFGQEFHQPPPQPPKASADAILSLYGAAPQHQVGMQQNHQGHGISMMMGPPNGIQGHHMGMGVPPRGVPPHNPMGYGGGLYPPQQQGFGHQPLQQQHHQQQQQGFPGMMGGGFPQQHQQQPLGFGQPQGFPQQQHQQYPPQQQHQQQPLGFGQTHQQPGFGFPQQQTGMYPNQQRGW